MSRYIILCMASDIESSQYHSTGYIITSGDLYKVNERIFEHGLTLLLWIKVGKKPIKIVPHSLHILQHKGAILKQSSNIFRTGEGLAFGRFDKEEPKNERGNRI
jgi:hypothetical protein